MLKDNYKAINTIGIINFYYVKRHVLLGRLFVDERDNELYFITTKECYSISIMLNEAVFNKLSHFFFLNASILDEYQ